MNIYHSTFPEKEGAVGGGQGRSDQSCRVVTPPNSFEQGKIQVKEGHYFVKLPAEPLINFSCSLLLLRATPVLYTFD